MLKSVAIPCVLASVSVVGACHETAAPSHAAPNLSGTWQHAIAHYLPADESPGPVVNMPGLTFAAMNVWVGDYRNPILQPWASEAVRVRAVAELERGEPLWSQHQLCMAFGVPHALLLREPIQLLQDPGMVTILYQHDNQVRRIYLNEAHPPEMELSPYGHSVGHYEGDTLVVDTLAMSNTGAIDFYGTPHTAALHVAERYRLSEDGKVLEVNFTVSDPGAFTAQWHGLQRYYPVALTVGFRENICAENIRFGPDGELPVPMDDLADF